MPDYTFYVEDYLGEDIPEKEFPRFIRRAGDELRRMREMYAVAPRQGLDPERMAVVLGDLYSAGATIVSSEYGYGIYFREEDTLYFVELQADTDRAAEVLMEAAREKEVIVEKAVITVGAAQPLFLGEGTRQEYGMIRFDAEPFDVSESYLRLMLEN